MILDQEGICKFLPHRPPFLFLDSIEKIITPKSYIEGSDKVRDLQGASVIAKFKVSDDLEILRGHFPGMPILPGVVQVEMMAQASAFIFLPLCNYDHSNFNVETLLVSISNSKFRKVIVPGMELDIKATLTRCRGTIGTYAAEICHNDEKVAEAEFMAKLSFEKVI